MPDPITIASAAGALKSTFDALRSAMGLLKDAKDLLPSGDQREKAISQALVTAESSSKIAEAEIAKALGYELCKCAFPPTIMLTVGTHNGRSGAHWTSLRMSEMWVQHSRSLDVRSDRSRKEQAL